MCPVKGCAGDVAWLSSHHMPIYLHRLRIMLVLMLSWLQWAKDVGRRWSWARIFVGWRKIVIVLLVSCWLRSHIRFPWYRHYWYLGHTRGSQWG